MKNKRLDGGSILVFETGEEVVSTLTAFAIQTKKYLSNQVNEQVEVVSLTGDITLDKGEPKIHAHAVVGKKSGAAMGGHLLEAHVRPTLELILQDSGEQLKRKFDPESGLALIDLEPK